MASSSSSASNFTVQPVPFGGYGRQTGHYGGLEGVEFAARCPPDVQKNTRIVAICGIPEYRASPERDGWFFSDLFLFYQMLGNRSELPNRLWFLNSSPRDLIGKHKRYLHGPATGIAGDRRVVMNEAMLPNDEAKAGFRVCKAEKLLPEFLTALKHEIEEAARAKQPVLIFIFGHGKYDEHNEYKTDDIYIGTNKDDLPKLTPDGLASALRKDVETTVVLTSCYSGGWHMKPNFNTYFDIKPRFNHSFIIAAGYDNESLAWQTSKSPGRQAGGSIFATCLLNSIITASDTSGGTYRGGRPNNDIEESRLVKIKEDDNGNDISLSMAALSQQIVYECRVRYGTLWDRHEFSFAVQDDLWATSWGKRTGLPVLNYKEMWESLPDAPPMMSMYPDSSQLKGSIMSKSPLALQSLVRLKALRYMNSHPGLDNAGGNTCYHPGFYKLIEGVPQEFDELYHLDEVLDHRLSLLELADYYCYVLGIVTPKDQQIERFDVEKWYITQDTARHNKSPEIAKVARELFERKSTVLGWVMRLHIFDLPSPGLSYHKPKEYLAIRLAETPLSTEQIYKKLEDLVQYKLADARRVACSPLGVAILSEPKVKTLREGFYKSVSSLHHRLRSLSPRKKARRSEAEGRSEW